MLEGIRILDLSRVLAGPLATMMLGDLGADVIKVERPGGGDETRGWGPPFDERGESAYFLAINRNKRSVTLDLDHPADQAVLRGLAPPELLESNPRLVWCTLTGFGAGSNRPGYDFVVQAEAGWMAITGEADGAPMKLGVALADVIAGKDAAVAILALLAAPSLPRTPAERRIIISL